MLSPLRETQQIAFAIKTESLLNIQESSCTIEGVFRITHTQMHTEQAPLTECTNHDGMGGHCGRRAREGGACVRQGRGSARSLRVFDLKAAVADRNRVRHRRHQTHT